MNLDKWVNAVSERDSVERAASYSLRDRIACLQQFFPIAAISRSECVEDVHQLRTSARRALAVLEVYAELFPTKSTKSLRRSLKKILRASGTVRDLDVLANRYRNREHSHLKKFVKELGRRRSRLQPSFTKLNTRMQQGKYFLNQGKKLLSRIGKSRASKELAEIWMKARWMQLVELFYQSADVKTNNLDGLHRFRINSKQLRYGLELLAPAFDFQKRERAYAFIEQLQERLGRLQDHVVAHKLFCDWNSKRNRISKSCDLESLIQGEFEKLQKEQYGFAAWWTPALKAEMREAFNQLAS